MNVIYNPNSSDVIGIYIGTGHHISGRIRRHYKTKSCPFESNEVYNIRSGIKRLFETSLIVLDTCKDISLQGGKDPCSVLLNIREVYTILLFRSLGRGVPLKYLPKQSTIAMYAWTPLDKQYPLSQYRNGLDNHLPDSERKSRRPGRRRFYSKTNWLTSKHREFLIRKPDAMEDDKVQVEIVCKRCRDHRTAFVPQRANV